MRLELLIAAVFLLLLPGSGFAFYEINDLGGQCDQIGIWDESARTCTLTNDIDESIVITSASVTVDGDGHSITGTDAFQSYGVRVPEDSDNVIIRDLTIERFSIGIYFDRADAGTADTVVLRNNGIGIDFFQSSDSVARGATIERSDGSFMPVGIAASQSNGLSLNGNKITNAETGIDVQFSSLVTIDNNEISEMGTAISLRNTDEAEIRANQILSPEGQGLRLEEIGGGNRIYENTFQGAGDTAIFILFEDDGGEDPVPTVSESSNVWSIVTDFFSSIGDQLAGLLAPFEAIAQTPEDTMFFANNFVGNETHVTIRNNGSVAFSRELPDGGNYWDTFNEENEGCFDEDVDGFCDSPYEIDGDFVDDHPRVNPVGVLPPPPEEGASSVLFLPGFQGSALKEGDDVLWPPSAGSQDIERLALHENGESVNDIAVAGVLSDFHGTSIYGEFASFMDELVDEGAISSWEPFAYDWRFPPNTILEEGVNQDGEDEPVDLIETIEDLASESETGKVTIIAHSMGGFLAKALLQRLESDGNADIVDALVLVGTPQLGTPQAAASLLHGDQPVIMNIFLRSFALRATARNMIGAHTLLPSATYFDDSSMDDVITFNQNASFTESWRARWGSGLDSYEEFVEFLTGTGVSRDRPQQTTLAQPEVLLPAMVSAASEFHADFDTYEIPAHIRVVQVVGWGLPTVETIEYKTEHLIFQGFDTHVTLEGDNTVVYPSAVASNEENSYYFNLSNYNALEDENDVQHRNLLDASPVQEIVRAVLTDGEVTVPFITDTKPSPATVDEQLVVATRSPVVLGVQDEHGNFTGIDQSQDLNSDLLLVTEEIPGSTFLSSGEDQLIFLPKEGAYDFQFTGTGDGPVTVEIGAFSDDTIQPVATYTDISVNVGSIAGFSVETATPEATTIQFDVNGDGQVDTVIEPDGHLPPSDPTLEELVSALKTKIQVLDIKPKLKANLLKKIEGIEKKIEKQKQKKSRILSRFQEQIEKKVAKGKIDAMSASEITDLLTELEAQSATFPLDHVLLQTLRTKVENLQTPQTLKNNLLKRVARLEKTSALSQSLERLTDIVTRKGAQGKITDADVQELLDLLAAIEGTL